jgi:conjugative transposon TraM protein
MKQHSEKFLRKRKFLLVLPVLIIPFLTMAFWAAGGGKESAKLTATAGQGLNTKLPDPKLKDDHSLNKLSFYEMAQKDSQKLKIEMENVGHKTTVNRDSDKYDLNRLKSTAEGFSNKYHLPGLIADNELNVSLDHSTKESKSAEENLLRKLDQLQREVNKPVNDKTFSKRVQNNDRLQRNVPFSSDIERLENMMKIMKDNPEGDPEINKLDTVLEKILDVQHPDRVKEHIEQNIDQRKKEVVPVREQVNLPSVSLFGDTSNGGEHSEVDFYGSKDHFCLSSDTQNVIEAAVHETQTLVSGSVVKLRLLNDINVNGSIISKGNFVFGIAKLNGERLTIEIPSISYHNSIYPVNLDVYDLDGLQGIYVPAAITRDVAKRSAGSSIQTLGLSTVDPSLGAQAATAGINAAKELLSKKIKVIKVTVKAGYKVLLKANR